MLLHHMYAYTYLGLLHVFAKFLLKLRRGAFIIILYKNTNKSGFYMAYEQYSFEVGFDHLITMLVKTKFINVIQIYNEMFLAERDVNVFF